MPTDATVDTWLLDAYVVAITQGPGSLSLDVRKREDGALLWARDLAATTEVQISSDNVIVLGSSPRTGLDVATGDELWTAETSVDAGPEAVTDTQPAASATEPVTKPANPPQASAFILVREEPLVERVARQAAAAAAAQPARDVLQRVLLPLADDGGADRAGPPPSRRPADRSSGLCPANWR